jgi:SAM-dependent methyltransferase
VHASVMQFIEQVRPDPAGLHVLEVGSRNVNGSVRPLFAGAEEYVGIDRDMGEGVDQECTVEEYLRLRDRETFDVVVSAEMLEHAADWKAAFRAMCELLVPGGTLLLTTRSEGFPRHNPPDYWRFDPACLIPACRACGLKPLIVALDPQVPGVFLKAVKLEMPDATPMPQP